MLDTKFRNTTGGHAVSSVNWPSFRGLSRADESYRRFTTFGFIRTTRTVRFCVTSITPERRTRVLNRPTTTTVACNVTLLLLKNRGVECIYRRVASTIVFDPLRFSKVANVQKSVGIHNQFEFSNSSCSLHIIPIRALIRLLPPPTHSK